MTATPDRVADASVFAALVFEEPTAGVAEELLQSAVLHEPGLLLYELASIARNKTLRHPERGQQITQGLANALSMNISWVEVDPFAILQIALDTPYHQLIGNHLSRIGPEAWQRVAEMNGGLEARSEVPASDANLLWCCLST